MIKVICQDIARAPSASFFVLNWPSIIGVSMRPGSRGAHANPATLELRHRVRVKERIAVFVTEQAP
jgi:hypothetical protein